MVLLFFQNMFHVLVITLGCKFISLSHNLSGNGYTTTLELEVSLSDVEYEAEADDSNEI